MTEENYIFHCSKYKPISNGEVGYYILEIIDRESGEAEELLVTPRELASPVSMKRILLGRRILYSATRKKHDEMLRELFANRPEPSNISLQPGRNLRQAMA